MSKCPEAFASRHVNINQLPVRTVALYVKNIQLCLFFNTDNSSTPTVANPSEQRQPQRHGVQKAHRHKEMLAVEAAQELQPQPSSEDSSVSALPLQPDSPWMICSQYRKAQHDEATTALPAREEPPTFIMVQENVSDQRLRIELGQEQIFKRDSDLQLYVITLHLP